MRLGAKEWNNHSKLFSASFLNGVVETVLLADPGAGKNFLPLMF